MKPLIEVQDLAVSYDTYAGEVQSVRGVSFRILKGQTVALVGVSGCGKSVTAKSLMGVIEKPGRVKDKMEWIPGEGDFYDFSGCFGIPESDHAYRKADQGESFKPFPQDRQTGAGEPRRGNAPKGGDSGC